MYAAIARNKRNTIFIMIGFVLIIGALGVLMGYMYDSPSLAIGIGGGAIIYAIIQYFLSMRIAMFATGAQEIQKSDNPRLYRIVENLAITNGMPMPKVCIMDDPAPNAFATGRDPEHALVAGTTGLLNIMNDRELEAVFAHEMAHVKNYDIRVSMIAFGLASAIGVMADMLLRVAFFSGGGDRDARAQMVLMAIGVVAAILLPIVAMMIQMAISRQREYLADATGVQTTRDPEALANALEKIKNYSQPMQRQSTATAHLFFSNPLSGKAFSKLFSTHPPIDDRIARLRGSLREM